jgi:hypothetical protein
MKCFRHKENVIKCVKQLAFENFHNTSYQLYKISVAFENFSTTPYEKLSKTRLTCMAIHAQKQNVLLLFVGGRSLLPNGATPRSDPTEHVLFIIQRLLEYAQLATRLANPRRYL